MILGIDPGKQGGFALVDKSGRFIKAIPMPLTAVAKTIDTEAICRFLSGICDDVQMATFEEISGFVLKKCGKTGIRELGRNLGQIEMGLTAFKIPFGKIMPQQWQRVMHHGIDKKLPPKERSHIAFAKRFPGLDLKKSYRCEGNHEGMVEAVLIADWTRIKYFCSPNPELLKVAEAYCQKNLISEKLFP